MLVLVTTNSNETMILEETSRRGEMKRAEKEREVRRNSKLTSLYSCR